MPLESSPDAPLPLRTVAKAIGDWVARLGRVWVEGQITEISRRPGMSTVFLVLRDSVADVSVPVRVGREVLAAVAPPPATGARVAIWARPEFYLTRGSLSLVAYEIRPLGLGELLARLERLRSVLQAEGLFAPARRRPLPFLADTVGLITGRASAAERDVRENALRRWPGVRFRVEPVAVQGPSAVSQLLDALAALDRDPRVEVIVIARGGGSTEDLLPFSDEALLRAVAGSRTPVVSAIGHESDTPLLDQVADRRASTPTDAGKLVVPDVAEELATVAALRAAARRRVELSLLREEDRLAQLRRSPAFSGRLRSLEQREADVATLSDRARRGLTARLDRAAADLDHTRARVAALSPAATLARGYAVVQDATGGVVRDPADVRAGDALRVRVAGGEFAARAGDGVSPGPG